MNIKSKKIFLKDQNKKKNFKLKYKKENKVINKFGDNLRKTKKKNKGFSLGKNNLYKNVNDIAEDVNNINNYKFNTFDYNNIKTNINHSNFKNNHYNKNKNFVNNFIKKKSKKFVKFIRRNVIIGENISINELSNKMSVKNSEVIKILKDLGKVFNIDKIIDQKTAKLIAEKMGHKVNLIYENKLEKSIILNRNINNINIIKYRAPIITIMGHVDHGKTSLIDYIRSTKLVVKEPGSITQRIGAYYVEIDKKKITFIDTPGHSAFTSMRLRGTQITDIVVLVVAADDGVKLQTIEAINQATLAKVPIIVAINKIDKKDIDIKRVKNELIKYNITPEDWGGQNQFVNISAKSGLGINNLLKAIILQAEILDLKVTYNGMASGVIIDSYLDKGCGPVASILVREGTLNVGDVILCGSEYGKVRAIRNEIGKNIYSAGPSLPVEIFGLSGVPIAGDEIIVVYNEKKAREVALYRRNKFKEIKLSNKKQIKSINIFDNINKIKFSDVNIILKSNVFGSMEAINDLLNKLSTDKIKIKIISSGVGNINKTDVMLAINSNSILIAFNVCVDNSVRRIINLKNIKIWHYSIIYHLIDDIKKIINNKLELKYHKDVTGLAEIRNIFNLNKNKITFGCIVTQGIIKRNNKIRILRKNIVIYEGEIESLRRFKDSVNEVLSGMECGICINNYINIKSGDKIEFFKNIKI